MANEKFLKHWSQTAHQFLNLPLPLCAGLPPTHYSSGANPIEIFTHVTWPERPWTGCKAKLPGQPSVVYKLLEMKKTYLFNCQNENVGGSDSGTEQEDRDIIR